MSGIRLTDGQPGPATQTELGLVIQATDAEVAQGLNTGKYVTPAALATALPSVLGLGTAAFEDFTTAVFNASDLQGLDIATTVPTDGQALVWNLANSRWQPGTVSTTVGTVTSVNASGGTTGLSFSGGPVTTSGTLTLAGTLAVANGGTGATDNSGARTNLGLAIGTNVQAYDAGLASIAGLTTSADQGIYTTAADTYATFSLTSAGRALLDDADAAAQRTTLGLGSAALLTAAAPSGAATLDGSGKLVSSQIPDISVTEYLGSVASEAAMLALSGQKGDWAIRSDLGTTWIITGNDPTVLASWTQLSYPAAQVTSVFGRTGAIAAVSSDYSSVGLTGTAIGASSPSSGAFTTLSCPSISFTGGSITGITDLAVADGGTGASDASGARANLSAAVLGANGDITSLTGVTGGISSPDFVQFDTAAAASSAVGKLFWNDADGAGTLSVGLKGGNVVHNVGQETFYRVKASAAISKGQVVMFSGVVGGSGQITGAPATGLTPSQGNYIIGVAAEGGALNDWVLVSSFGFVRGFNTTGGAESWVAGDSLYYNPAVAGGLTKVIPNAPNPRVEVAAVISADASTGEVLVRVTHGSELGGTDSNVQVGTLADNDFLVYNLANARWQNYSAAASRTALSLVVGTDVQAYDAGLTSIAGLTTSADQGIYTTAADTYATFSLTSAGRALLDDADAAAQRTTLGLGSIATQAASSVSITGGSITGITDLAVADGGTGASTAADARVNLLPSYTGNGSKVLSLNSGATDTEWVTVSAGAGTVTSVNVSGGTTGLTTSGGPVTSSGTITLAGTLAVANGGTGITSLGSGVATFLGTPSSANLAAAVTDETGTGALVFANSPTLVTPILGAATATSINGVTVTGTSTPALSVTGTTAVSGTNTGDQTTITGNAGTATALQTARTIGGVSFNGTANINLPGVNTAGNQNTTGNAATAGGFTPSQTNGVANRIVVADASGYINNNYFFSTDNSVASGVTAVMVKQGNDYLRSGTAAAIATFISGQAMNISGSSTSCSGNAASASTVSGTQTTMGTSGSALNTSHGGQAGPQVLGNGGGGAVWSLHRPGAFGLNIGLDSDNVFRIGGWSAGANRLQLDMSGNATMAGNVTAYSDERLKKDWSPVPADFVDRLASILAGTYTRIDSGERQAGVSAQAMQAILPETVSEDSTGTLSLAYGNAAMVSVVELSKRVVELEKIVASLLAK